MPTIVRPSGIRVETNGFASVGDGGSPDLRQPLEGLVPPQTRRRAIRARRELTLLPQFGEIDAIARAFSDEGLELIDRIPINATAAPTGDSGVRRRQRFDATRSGAVGDASEVSVVGLQVPLADDEQAVVLLEEGGVFTWVTAIGQSAMPLAPDPAPGTITGARREKSIRRKSPGAAAAQPTRSAAASGRVALFRFEITLESVAPSSAPPPSTTRRARRAWKGFGLRAVVAAVFRFVAKPFARGVATWLEQDRDGGPVQVRGIDPADWLARQALPTKLLSAPTPRLLLLVHGTFSSTVGTFGDLAASDEGRIFLEESIRTYDCILGWDHRTLTRTPTENAQDLLGYLESQKWRPGAEPQIDVIAFSRGGLVFRSLVEEIIPNRTESARRKLNLNVRRVVFTGCTNGGTELANPKNWSSLADRYTNLAAAASRVLARVPVLTAKMIVFEHAVRGVAGFVKALATSVADDEVVPGLAALNPNGTFVRTLNGTQTGQPAVADTYYCAITSNFDYTRAELEGDGSVPPGLLVRMADGFANRVFGEPNDLVVHVAGMTMIDPQVGAYIRERLDYGANGLVHHCAYFSQSRTAASLGGWLLNTIT